MRFNKRLIAIVNNSELCLIEFGTYKKVPQRAMIVAIMWATKELFQMAYSH